MSFYPLSFSPTGERFVELHLPLWGKDGKGVSKI